MVDLISRWRAPRSYVAPEPSPQGIEVQYQGSTANFHWRWAAFASAWGSVILSVIFVGGGLLMIGARLSSPEAPPAWISIAMVAGGVAFAYYAAIPTWRNSTALVASRERIEVSHGPGRAPAPKSVEVADIESLDHEQVGNEGTSYEVVVRLRSTGARVVLVDFGDNPAPSIWLANELRRHLQLQSSIDCSTAKPCG